MIPVGSPTQTHVFLYLIHILILMLTAVSFVRSGAFHPCHAPSLNNPILQHLLDRADEGHEVYNLGPTVWALGSLRAFVSGVFSFPRNRIMSASQLSIPRQPRINFGRDDSTYVFHLVRMDFPIMRALHEIQRDARTFFKRTVLCF